MLDRAIGAELRFDPNTSQWRVHLPYEPCARVPQSPPEARGLGSLSAYVKATLELNTGAPKRPRVMMPIAQIKRYVCEKHHVSLQELVSVRRLARLVLARHEAFWIARHHTANSYPEIGRAFGKRDHTTVLSGIRKFDAMLAAGLVEEPDFKLQPIACGGGE